MTDVAVGVPAEADAAPESGRPTKLLPLGHLVRISLYWLGLTAIDGAVGLFAQNQLNFGPYKVPDLEVGRGTIVVMSSTAGLVAYEGGGGYAAAQHAQTAVAETLRLELNGRPIRVVEIDPGLVRTDEFALVRFGGDAERAAAVYAGVPEPLVAEDIADIVSWVVSRPHHVNVDRLVVRPLAQAAQHKLHRVS